MMAQVNAGRVRFVGRGEYNNSTQYYVFDLVSYNGNSYYAKVDTIGNLPTDTTYWQLVAEKGNVGPTGPTGNGISSITKTGTSGLVDTYTITFTNGNTTTFDVSNGNGIDRIEKTATVGNIDTYTIYFNDNSTSTFEVANGEVTREELEEEVDRLSMIYNLFPTTSDEDTEMTLDGTGEVKLKKIGLKGNTEQNSYSGINMMDMGVKSETTTNNVKYSANNDIIYLNGTANAGTTIGFDFEQNLILPAGTYNFYLLRKNTARIDISVRGLNGVTVNETNFGNKFQNILTNTSFTLANETTFTRIVVYIPSGVALSNEELKMMICATSHTADEWEPYTGGIPAPNPDYPQDIQVVSGDNTVVVCGKNLLDVSQNEEGGINEDGSASTNNRNRRGTQYIPVLPNTQYTLSSNKNVSSLKLNEYTTDKINIQRDSVNYVSALTITTTATTYYLRWSINYDNTQKFTENLLNTLDVQLEKSSTASTYEPYQSASYPVSLGNIELCKIGDYQDYIRKSTGKNLFDKNSANIIQNKYLNDSGVETSDNSFSISDYIKVDANTVYSNQPFENKNACICFYNSSKTFLSSKRLTQIEPNFTTPNNCAYIRTSIWRADIDLIQIEKGNQATTYEPYGKVWYIHKDIGKVVLDGSEDYSIRNQGDGSTTITFNLSNFVIPNGSNKYCNYFSYNQSSQNGVEGYGISNNTIYFEIKRERLSSLDVSGFKTWLSTHNTEVLYVLATPTTTEITDTTLIEQLDNLEKAYSYDTQTNISQTNADKPFILDVEAILSLKNILN